MAQPNNRKSFTKITTPRFVQSNAVMYRTPPQRKQGVSDGKGGVYVPPVLEVYIIAGYWPIDYAS